MKKAKSGITYLVAFVLPVILVAIAWWLNGVYPGSKLSVLASDSFTQTVNFYDAFHDVLHGNQSWFYTWSGSLGVNFLGIYSYYLGGVVTPIVYFFSKSDMANAVYVITLIKIGLAGVTAFWYAKTSFRLQTWQNHLLALCYAMMSFGLAFAEQPMWLDTLYILPIIIIGINRVIDGKGGNILIFGYFLLFITNFYMAYIVGIFSFLYFCVGLYRRGELKQKLTWLAYGWRLVIALGLSAIIIIPTVVTMINTHIPLSKVNGLFTDNTGIWDLIIKNMVGVYDTTKFGTIPFVSVGLLPLIFAISFFFLKKITKKSKIGMAVLLGCLCLGFYFQPFDLAWQGGHFPAMFLFRYSFLFSFLVIQLAGEAWETKPSFKLLSRIIISLGILMIVAYFGSFGHYHYLSVFNLLSTLIILAAYLVLFSLLTTDRQSVQKGIVIILSIMCCVELTGNAYGIFLGTKKEWHYPLNRLYTQNYPAISKIVSKYQKKDVPLRMESMDPVSRNDGFNYNYSSINLFSSMRNRPFMQQMNKLGYRSTGDNLNLIYGNNTVLMDSLLGNQLIIAKGKVNRVGYQTQPDVKPYHVYKNQYAAGLGTVTNDRILKLKLSNTDNLGNQSQLLNDLSQQNQTYFKQQALKLLPSPGARISIQNNQFYGNMPSDQSVQRLTWKVKIPAHQQAYLSLYPLSGTNLGGLMSEVKVDKQGVNLTSRNSMTGQYIDLGNYKKATTITIHTNIWGSKQFRMVMPNVILMNTNRYEKSMTEVQRHAAKLKISGDTITGKVNVNRKNQVLVTSVPYDDGWRLTVNHQAASLKAIGGAFVGVKLHKGQNQVQLKYRPSGWYVGVIISSISLVLLIGEMVIKKRKNN
ncbi:YfhO family protein [Levilactobacillus bambusae]|nr:YfhO family protein [Levilactobacillus bambusae]